MRTAITEAQRLQYLEAMGIQQWVERPSEEIEPVSSNLTVDVDAEYLAIGETRHTTKAGESVSLAVNWDVLQRNVAQCTACDLHKTRIQTVFGVGDSYADCMVIGEAPGASEDRQGEPFVGKAGMLLNEMLRAIGLNREQVFIANILKCRPPGNRDPKIEEVDACESFLNQQLLYVNPKLILAVGRVAAQNLLKTDSPIGRLRGKVHHYRKTPLVVVYHPAYLLRSPLEKRRAWSDLQLALKVLSDNV